MPNLRIIYDNAADRAALSSSATAAGLGYANLQVNTKSKVCRSTTKNLVITAQWANAETIGGVILPFCNFSPTATIQIQAYTVATDTTPAVDVTANALSGTPFTTGQWVNGGVNSFAFGGGSYARIWLATKVVAKKLVITIADSGNSGTYIEASRLVIGDYWEPQVGAVEGSTFSVGDTSKHFRTDAGDQYTDTGTRFRKQSISLPSLDSADRLKLWNILWGNGMSVPVFISLYPNNADTKLEQANQIFGKLQSTPIMGTPYFNHNSATVEIEEV